MGKAIDNLDKAYKIVKRSSLIWAGIIVLSAVVTLLSRFSGLFLVLGLPVFVGFFYVGITSSVGCFYAFKGSQFDRRNPKKRFFGLFGNLLFVAAFFGTIALLISDIIQLLK